MSAAPRLMKASRSVALAAALALSGAAELAAQTQSPFFARKSNNKEPINIESDSLELRDKDKTATFINNVKLVQGDMTVECKVLVVHYEDPPSATTGTTGKTRSGAAPQSQSREQQIKLLQASGGVVVTQRDQVATGDSGTFDMKANTATIVGNVVLTQGQNVVRGDRLWIDMNTNISRVESKKAGDGRVQGLFLPRDAQKPPEAAPAAPSRPGARNSGPADQTRNASSDRDSKPKPPPRPLRLN
jgi:lipopolysaccharide export system protein LptA